MSCMRVLSVEFLIYLVEEVKVEVKKEKKLSFLRKFLELQVLMIHHNNALTKSHPYSSSAISWPFVVRGISFWETKEGLKQIYLLGNPFAWWFAILGPFLYLSMWCIDRVLLQRGVDDFGKCVRGYWDRCIGFLVFAWGMHWAPFFLMNRMLFLHHYMPAYIISVLVSTVLVDFLFRDFVRPMWTLGGRMKSWRGKEGLGYAVFVALVCAIVGWGFWYFSPLCYGTGFATLDSLKSRKWIESWDLQYA